MEFVAETIEIAAPDGAMPGLRCTPVGASRAPALLVIMEAFGVDRHVRSVAERLAREGYLTLAPDLYYRESERTIPYSDVGRAADILMRTIALGDAPEERVKDDRVMADLGAALSALKAQPGVAADRIGLFGLSMGARLAFLLACRRPREARAVVSFYGGHLVPILEESRHLEAPILLLFGDEDASIPLPQVDRIQAELRYRGKRHEVRIYPGAGHGFLCEERPSYHADVARESWNLALDWLSKHLA